MFDDESLAIIDKIVAIFNENVKGKKPTTASGNEGHDGRYGHWLEARMGIVPNGDNAPDLMGFEMKNNTRSKTTFGDWSADFYLFKDDLTANMTTKEKRHRFITSFGKYNSEKMRYSWSGTPFPKFGKVNDYGQIITFDEDDNVVILYNYSLDKRPDKDDIVPSIWRRDNLVLARWDRASLKSKLENKFNQRGWFKCLQGVDQTYTRIVFGGPIVYEDWIKKVVSGDVYLDSGMYSDLNKTKYNSRPYSSWRADNKFWDSMISLEF